MTGRARILMVTRNFPPLVGGMERLVAECHRALATRFDVALVGPEGSDQYVPGAAVCRLRPLPRFLACATLTTRRQTQAFSPDLVFCGSGLVSLPAALGARGVPRIVYLHGLDIVAPSAIYQGFFVPSFRGARQVITNSQHTRALAIGRGVAQERVAVVSPGVAIPRPQGSRPEARARLGLRDDVPVVVSVGRLTPRKGLLRWVSEALPELLRRHPSLVLVVAGDDPSGGVQQTGIGARLRALIAERHLEDTVRLLGQVDEATLETVYRAADAHVFPVEERAGDVEGFGMVALEAAAFGVPTFGYAVGGVPDAVKPGVSGVLVPPADQGSLVDVLDAYLSGRLTFVRADITAFAAHHSWEVFGEALLSVVVSVCPDSGRSRSVSR